MIASLNVVICLCFKPSVQFFFPHESSVCVAAFQAFLGRTDVSRELDEVHAESRAQNTQRTASVLELFRKRSLRWQLITVIVVMSCYQLCGLNAVSSA